MTGLGIKIPKSTILITGAGGLNGSAIIREFVHQRIPVRAMVRNLETYASSNLDTGITYMKGDMIKTDTLAHILEGVDRVLLISTADREMVETQCSFVDACKVAGVRHVIKFSGEESGIGFDPQNFRFTRMHEQIEDYLECSGLEWTHLRPSQFMQVYLREAASIKSSGALFLPFANATLSPVDVYDIARIAVSLLHTGGHESESLRITGPQSLSMTEVAAIIEKVIGNPVRYVNISPEERRRSMLAAGVPQFMVEAINEQTLERLRHPESRVDLTTHQLFDLTPTYFEEFVLRNAAVFGMAN